eukprot:262387-Amphidinium_carterae.1
MAAKMLRVYAGPELARTSSHPMKTGDSTGKFEADGLLSIEDMAKLQSRAEAMRAADIKVSRDELRSRFEAALRQFPQIVTARHAHEWCATSGRCGLAKRGASSG